MKIFTTLRGKKVVKESTKHAHKFKFGKMPDRKQMSLTKRYLADPCEESIFVLFRYMVCHATLLVDPGPYLIL